MIILNSMSNLRAGNRMATSVNADPSSELVTRIRYEVPDPSLNVSLDQMYPILSGFPFLFERLDELAANQLRVSGD